MPSGSDRTCQLNAVATLLLSTAAFLFLLFPSSIAAEPVGRTSLLRKKDLPSSSSSSSSPSSPRSTGDFNYLPAQVGGIVGAYALSLVLVAILLLVLSKKRREHLLNGEGDSSDAPTFNPFPAPFLLQSEAEYHKQLQEFNQQGGFQSPKGGHYRNFSLPSNASLSPSIPISPTRLVTNYPYEALGYHYPSSSTILAPGIDLSVDQSVVAHDKNMAQQQLEDMYKYVMEHERAKEEGREYDGPPLPASPSTKSSPVSPTRTTASLPLSHNALPLSHNGNGNGDINSNSMLKKERGNKPANLNLNNREKEEKSQSRTSSFLSMLKSPRRKGPKGISISSPMALTPMSGTFPRYDGEEMNPISPRHYAPPPPPPVPPMPNDQLPFRRAASHFPTPDISPQSTQSIDERLGAAASTLSVSVTMPPPPSERQPRSETRKPSYTREGSTVTTAPSEPAEPPSTTSERSTTQLVGLPTSPKPGVNRFPSLASLPSPSLPASPRPDQMAFGPGAATPRQGSVPSLHFPPHQHQQQHAVRAGGALPLRAYESSLSTTAGGAPSSVSSQTTKQTVFTRAAPGGGGPMSPGTAGLRTPWTGAPVPYTPYQPFSPVVPITPTLVTREDRKRMKRMVPKTPTLDMVKGDDEVW